MQVIKQFRQYTLLSHLGRVFVAASLLLALSQSASQADHRDDTKSKSAMRGNAGTAFNLAAVFDPITGNPVFPWLHEVRGVAQFSNLGNCTVNFDVQINAGTVCDGGHVFCLLGTLTIKTLAGDEIYANVVGWGDADPNDPKLPPSMNILHYDVTIAGGTGRFKDASGKGAINGAFFFCGTDCFCDSYAGVATWLYEGTLHVPKKRKD